jgi:hypothetical protein
MWLKKLGAHLLVFSNSFQNPAPKRYKTILHQNSQIIFQITSTSFILSFSLIHLHWEPVLTSYSTSRPSNFRLAV